MVGATRGAGLGAPDRAGWRCRDRPLLALGFGVDIRYAIGASLVSVIATLLWSGCGVCQEGIPISGSGCFLRDCDDRGALVGAFLATKLPVAVIAIIFGGRPPLSAVLSSRPSTNAPTQAPQILDDPPEMHGAYPTATGYSHIQVCAIPLGFSLMFGAGSTFGTTRIGSGAAKVLAMDQAMRIPFKCPPQPCNFMIGSQPAASAGVYLNRGYIDPGLPCPLC